jgi:hypothetical protein
MYRLRPVSSFTKSCASENNPDQLMKQVLKFTPEFILVCYILLFIFFKHPGETWDRSINSDGKGILCLSPGHFYLS